MMRRALLVAALLVAAFVPAAASEPRFELELEVGPVWQARNEVEIPNDGTATRFSLDDLVGSGPWPAGRLTFHSTLSGRHSLRVVLAPLSYTETGTFESAVLFQGQSYAAGVPTEATYTFDSWRIGYRYRFWQRTRWSWWVGFTAKIRDAEIRLQQGATTSRDTDLGFVPLAYLRGEYAFAERWRLLLELEALGGGPGRAEDLSIKLARDFGESWSLAFGYRTVEGGADVDEVYNFAWFHYALVSGAYRW